MGALKSLNCASRCRPDSCDTNELVESEECIPSALRGGALWDQASHIPETTSPDLEICVTVIKTSIELPAPHETIEVRLAKAEKLLQWLREWNFIDQPLLSKTSFARLFERQPSKLKQRLLGSASPSGGRPKRPPTQHVEMCDLTLPPWANTWRLKCAVAYIFSIPAKSQWVACSGMTADSCVTLNRPESLVMELPVYPKIELLPKRKSCRKTPRRLERESLELKPPPQRLNVVISVPSQVKSSKEALIPLKKLGPSVDSSDNTSRAGLSVVSSIVEKQSCEVLCPHWDETSGSYVGSYHEFPRHKRSTFEEFVCSSDEDNYSSHVSKGYGYVGNRSSRCQSSWEEKTSPSTTALVKLQKVKTEELKQATITTISEDEKDSAEFIFEQMNSIDEGASLIQVMTGLTKLGFETFEFSQLNSFYMSMGCQISDKVTVDDIHQFLEHDALEVLGDAWLIDLQEGMLLKASQLKEEARGIDEKYCRIEKSM